MDCRVTIDGETTQAEGCKICSGCGSNVPVRAKYCNKCSSKLKIKKVTRSLIAFEPRGLQSIG